MNVPFSSAQFFSVFRDYNETVWPAQIILMAIAGVVIACAAWGTSAAARSALSLLALLWLWMSLVYHATFFSAVNDAAVIFAVVFGLEAVILAYVGLVRRSVMFRIDGDAASVLGIVLQLYALVVYPIIGSLSSHAYPYAPTFGLPCPTTIFTFGILLWMRPSPPWPLLVVPVAWSLLGMSAATTFGVTEDYGLVIAAASVVALLIIRQRAPRADRESRHRDTAPLRTH